MADDDVLTENTPTLILDVCVCIGPSLRNPCIPLHLYNGLYGLFVFFRNLYGISTQVSNLKVMPKCVTGY